MTAKLDISVQSQEGKAKILLKGAIDEDSIFSEILSLEPQKRYEFDFDGVGTINSCGVREWTSFIKGLGSDCEIIYTKCQQIIIEQINMVHGFIPENAKIESFYAPYYCEELDKEYKILLKTEDIKEKKAPGVECPDGEHEMEFDALEGQYFSFVK